jgi:hypothetical protein
MPEASTSSSDMLAMPEPAQTVATETIPPSAAPQVIVAPTQPAAV